MKASFVFRSGVITALLSLAACHGDDLPDTTISSKKLDTDQIQLAFRVQAQDAEIDPEDNGVHFQATLYREKSDGFIQVVELSEGDTLVLTNGDTNIPLTKNVYPEDRDLQTVDYSAQVDQIVNGAEYKLAFNRQSGTSATNTLATVLSPTEFSVVPSVTPLTPTGTLTLNWLHVTGNKYEVSFRFSCGANGDQNVQSVLFPNHISPNEPVSPFVFDIDQYFIYPATDLTNCQIRATLWSHEDQSEMADAAFKEAEVSSIRVQRISTAIQRN